MSFLHLYYDLKICDVDTIFHYTKMELSFHYPSIYLKDFNKTILISILNINRSNQYVPS